MLASILINGCWGIGLALLYAGLRRWTSGPRQAQAGVGIDSPGGRGVCVASLAEERPSHASMLPACG